MKVMVTGATGFVGRHVVTELIKQGHDVIAVSRNPQKASVLTWYEDVQYYPLDVYDLESLPALSEFGNPDALMHLAWPGLPNYKDLFHFESNLPADYRFLKTMLDQGLQQILVTGTCFEYGMQNGCLKEKLQTQPDNPYALAKDTLRKFLQSLHRQKPFVLQWARLFYMYGEGQNSRSLIAQLETAINRGDKEFKMSGGEQLRDYLPVKEVAKRLVSLVEHRQFDGIVNICDGKPTSVRRLVEYYLINNGRDDMKLNLGHYPYPDYEPMAFWGSSEVFNRITS